MTIPKEKIVRAKHVFAIVVMLSAVIAVVLSRTHISGEAATGASPPGLPQDEASQAVMKEQMDDLRARQSAEARPKLRLPEDQRAGWISAWNRMRDCAMARGFNGVTAVAPSFGDGETPAPAIAQNSLDDDAVLRACPFDETLFDRDKVVAAIAAQAAGH